MSAPGGWIGRFRQHPRLVWGIVLTGVLLLVIVAIWGIRNPEVFARAVREGRQVLTEYPGLLFLSIAVLPAIGFPVSVLLVLAGFVFQSRYGMVGGMVAVAAAITVNIVLTYEIARRFAPWFRGQFEKRGYPLPEMLPGTALRVTILVRVTPGMPLFVQNYLLGLLKIPWRTYLLGSLPPQWVITGLVATGGGALLAGNWSLFIGAAFFFLALAAVLQRVHAAIRRRGEGLIAPDPGSGCHPGKTR